MCGIYLTVSIREEGYTLDRNELNVLAATPQPPDWLIRRGPDAWNTKEVIKHFDCTDNKTFTIKVTLYASVLQMRDTYVAQPVEIKSYCEPKTFINDTSSSSLLLPQQLPPPPSTTTTTVTPYLAWNGEIYEYYNRNKSCIESVYHSTVTDTKLVSQLLFEQVDFTSITTNSSISSSRIMQQQQTQIANVMGQLTNAEFAFCIVTEHCVFYGRDIFGRRSLLTGKKQFPVLNDVPTSMQTEKCRSNQTIWELASVATLTSNEDDHLQWQEVEPGLVHVHPICPPSNSSTTNTNKTECKILPPIQIHCVTPNNDVLSMPAAGVTNANDTSFFRQNTRNADRDASLQEFYCQQLHDALLEAVRRRCCCIATEKHDLCDNLSTTTTTTTTNTPLAATAVLFSGGLDSTVIAALALEAGVQELMLLTVSFIDQPTTNTTTMTTDRTAVPIPTTTAADAIAAEHSYQELCQLYPLAKIHLIHRIVDWENVQNVEEQIRTLAYPKTTTVMDVNIATALWFAASAMTDRNSKNIIDYSKYTHTTGQAPRVLLSGLGADELMGGYGRHRIAYNRGGYDELQKELHMDMNRLWERNLGRDDRILTDTSKEVRFPFLDPNVTRLIQSIPLQYVVDYTLEGGVGDKRILRFIAQQIGLSTAATAVKRAIQFGSRISHVSDKRRYGSRRKANAKSKS